MVKIHVGEYYKSSDPMYDAIVVRRRGWTYSICGLKYKELEDCVYETEIEKSCMLTDVREKAEKYVLFAVDNNGIKRSISWSRPRIFRAPFLRD